MDEAYKAKIPLLVGTCGTSGTDAGVDWTRDIAIEVARELGIAPKIACLYSEQKPADLVAKKSSGRNNGAGAAWPRDRRRSWNPANTLSL